MRLIDADALIDKSIELYCKDCDRRKGIKNGKWRIVYEIGDAPCRACGIDDMKDDIEAAPTIEPPMTSGYVATVTDLPPVEYAPVVRCKDCKEYIPWAGDYICGRIGSYYGNTKPNDFCSFGERSEE